MAQLGNLTSEFLLFVIIVWQLELETNLREVCSLTIMENTPTHATHKGSFKTLCYPTSPSYDLCIALATQFYIYLLLVNACMA